MRVLATRPQRLALGIAVLSAAALGTVSASASSASHTARAKSHGTVVSGTTVPTAKGTGGKRHGAPGAPIAVAYKPTSNAPGDLNAANTDFAGCMREHGQSTFPDFHASKDSEGHVLLRVKIAKGAKGAKGRAFEPGSSGYTKAMDACGYLLEKAGISFPHPSDLPPLPDPGKGKGESGTTRHIEPGKPGKPGKATSGLPSLTSVIKHA